MVVVLVLVLVLIVALVPLLLPLVGGVGHVAEGDDALYLLAGKDAGFFPLHKGADVGGRGHGGLRWRWKRQWQ